MTSEELDPGRLSEVHAKVVNGEITLQDVGEFSDTGLQALAAYGHEMCAAGRLQQADAAFGLLTLLNPYDGASWRGLGRTHLEAKDVIGAIAALSMALAIDENDLRARAMRGSALALTGAAQEARDDLTRVRENLHSLGTEAPAWRQYTDRLLNLLDASPEGAGA